MNNNKEEGGGGPKNYGSEQRSSSPKNEILTLFAQVKSNKKFVTHSLIYNNIFYSD
jgi:hypothetical protein